MDTDDADPAVLRDAAIGLLAQREHSARELRDKLARRFGPADALDDVLRTLAEEGLQSDARYAEARVRSRVGRGFGPLKIREELRQAGIQGDLIEQVLDTAGVSWRDNAEAAMQQKFRGPPADRRELARRSRFLAARGYPSGLIADLLLD